MGIDAQEWQAIVDAATASAPVALGIGLVLMGWRIGFRFLMRAAGEGSPAGARTETTAEAIDRLERELGITHGDAESGHYEWIEYRQPWNDEPGDDPCNGDHEWLDRPESDTLQCLFCGTER